VSWSSPQHTPLLPETMPLVRGADGGTGEAKFEPKDALGMTVPDMWGEPFANPLELRDIQA
jgi:hypothetical protein